MQPYTVCALGPAASEGWWVHRWFGAHYEEVAHYKHTTVLSSNIYKHTHTQTMKHTKMHTQLKYQNRISSQSSNITNRNNNFLNAATHHWQQLLMHWDQAQCQRTWGSVHQHAGESLYCRLAAPLYAQCCSLFGPHRHIHILCTHMTAGLVIFAANTSPFGHICIR